MMNEWKKKQEEKEKDGSAGNSVIDKMRLDQARDQARRQAEMEESGASSSLSVPKATELKAIEESYASDSFEDVSMSNSGSKKLDFLSGKSKMSKPSTRVEDSFKSDTSGFSASNSKSANEMKSNSRIGESSDVYDDDEFESLSKSHKEMNKVLPTVKKLETLKSIKERAESPVRAQTAGADGGRSIVQQYTRKENKQTMTDEGKYSYMSANDAGPNNLKEWSLKKNLEEAEHLI